MATTGSAVASSATSATLVNADGRYRFVIENSDANRLYILLGSGTASTSNYSFSLAQYENAEVVGHHGPIVGVWAADGSGYAMVTEFS